MSVTFGSTSRSAASRSGSSAPITVRRMTSRVIAAILGATANSLPTGQPATSAAVIRAISSVCRCTASRWNGASISLRLSRCRCSSSNNTELSPSTPRMTELASPAW